MVTGSFRCDQLDWRRTYGDHEDGRALATATLTTVQRAPIGHSRGWARLTIDHTNDRPGGTVTGICYDLVVRVELAQANGLFKGLELQPIFRCSQ